MDCFLSEGMEVIFRIALALLTMGKEELLLQDMEGVIKYFQKYMPAHFEANQEAVFKLAFEININQKKMKKLEKEYTTMKTKEKEDEIEIRRLKNENRLLRQKVDQLESESNALADRLIQGQVDRAEVDETTFVMKRELAALRQHDLDTNNKLEEALQKIEKLESLQNCENGGRGAADLDQKEEIIKCLQAELVKIKLKEAENEDTIKLLSGKICESELEVKTQREDVPEDSIASLQEELAASKLREAESNLALRDLKSKVGELNTMWLKHINKPAESNCGTPSEMPSTPKKFLGSLLENKTSNAAKLEEELMSTRLREVASFAELKELRLRVMELETQTHLSHNQLKRQTLLVESLNGDLEMKNKQIKEQQDQVDECQRKLTGMEGNLADQTVRERIRDVEKAQSIAELKQIISNLEYQNQQLVKNSEEKDQLMNLEDTMSNLRQQTNNFQLPTPECTPIVEYKLFLPYK